LIKKRKSKEINDDKRVESTNIENYSQYQSHPNIVRHQTNMQINQQMNTRIDLQMNTRIDQQVNTRIDLQMNTQINQQMNTRISQQMNKCKIQLVKFYLYQ